ncbi:MAG: YifB family Mg chelatase-like AAA ATPase [Myxococcaceae bacterium]|nr:YifB family Mg chelatase-like AAA ATPase [Myxococcaceae bacterium]
MLAKVKSGALMGVDAVTVDVEVDMTLGLPFFAVVGLPEGAVKESKVRVMSALKHCEFVLPHKRITVNLAPADIRKEGAAFELPIALGVLVAADQLKPEPLAKYLFGGELSLDGQLRPIRGVLPLALAARAGGFKGVVVPPENAPEAALVEGIEVIPVGHLRAAVKHLTGEEPLKPFDRLSLATPASSDSGLDLKDVRGQDEIKDALELAAAGSHNMIMSGPPGSGKTMLARRLPSILPPMTMDEALEVTKIYSVLGLLRDGQSLIKDRPFRAPHHTISDAGLVGGGPLARPGELSLAHRGVLFLDELPEFKKQVLEVLRQPLEEGVVRLARAAQKVTYQCGVMLIAAMNPCPCGYWNTELRDCRCGENRVVDYHARVSGPLLDRIDITLETRQVDSKHFASEHDGKPSSWYRDRVLAARARQTERFKSEPEVLCNAQMTPALLYRHCRISAAAQKNLVAAIDKHGLSARAHDRILKLARTRADLEGAGDIRDEDVAFAIECRRLDRRDYMVAAAHRKTRATTYNDKNLEHLVGRHGSKAGRP